MMNLGIFSAWGRCRGVNSVEQSHRIMKSILPILAFSLLSPAVLAVEKDVWYNAKGKAVKVTAAEKEKERFVPLWEKRELARDAARAARRNNRVSNSSNRYYYAYPGYGTYGYGNFYGYGGYYTGSYFPHHTGYCFGNRFRSRPIISGTYHGKGWSVSFGY